MVPAVPNAGFGLDPVGGPKEGRVVPANMSLYGRFRLDIVNRFTEPGNYSVQVKGAPIINGMVAQLQSNTITITVLP